MRVDSYDDGVACGSDADVEPGRGRADLVVEHADARVARGEVGEQLVGAVDRRTEGDEHLDGPGVVLREDRFDRRAHVRRPR